MVNLHNNAWKFTSTKTSQKVQVGTEIVDGESRIFVRDNGVGFDMIYAHRLFGAFQRLHSQSEFSGAGIGLATARRIVNRHGGRIWAEGAVGEGASFYFVIWPLLRPGARPGMATRRGLCVLGAKWPLGDRFRLP